MTAISEICLLGNASDFVKRGWTQVSYARDKKDNSVSPLDPKACKWCLVGALRKASSEDPTYMRRLDRLKVSANVHRSLKDFINYGSLTNWNDEDGRTQAEVISLLLSVEENVRRASHDL